MLSAHLHKQQNAAFARDAGYYKTTPFFISYMEDAQTLRRAGCDWAVRHGVLGGGRYADGCRAGRAFPDGRALQPVRAAFEPAKITIGQLEHKEYVFLKFF